MKLVKAMEELTIPDDVVLIRVTPEFRKAAKLLIEAGKKIKRQREPNGTLDFFRLPGETEE
ncbi:hypothetical protein ES703_09070 [subsurface metagenome]